MIHRLRTRWVGPGGLPDLFKQKSGLPSLRGKRQIEEGAVSVYNIN